MGHKSIRTCRPLSSPNVVFVIFSAYHQFYQFDDRIMTIGLPFKPPVCNRSRSALLLHHITPNLVAEWRSLTITSLQFANKLRCSEGLQGNLATTREPSRWGSCILYGMPSNRWPDGASGNRLELNRRTRINAFIAFCGATTLEISISV